MRRRNAALADLRSVPRLGTLPHETLWAIDRAGDRCVVWPGEVLVRAGERIHWLCIVLDGELAERRAGDERVLRAGEIFGAVELVGRSPAVGSLIARDRTAVLAIPEQRFRALVGTQAAFGEMILRGIVNGDLNGARVALDADLGLRAEAHLG